MVGLVKRIAVIGENRCGQIVTKRLAHRSHFTTTPVDVLIMLNGMAVLMSHNVAILTVIHTTSTKVQRIIY